jgi:hypothetical protein
MKYLLLFVLLLITLNLRAQQKQDRALVWKVWTDSSKFSSFTGILKAELEHALRVYQNLEVIDLEYTATKADVIQNLNSILTNSIHQEEIDSFWSASSSELSFQQGWGTTYLVVGTLSFYYQKKILRLTIIDLSKENVKKSISFELPDTSISSFLPKLRKELKLAIFELFNIPLEIYINYTINDQYIDKNYDLSKIDVTILGLQKKYNLDTIKPNYWKITLPQNTYRLEQQLWLKISAPGFRDTIFKFVLSDQNIILYELNPLNLSPPIGNAESGKIGKTGTAAREGYQLPFFNKSILVRVDRKEIISGKSHAFIRITPNDNNFVIVPGTPGELFSEGKQIKFIYDNYFYQFSLDFYGKVPNKHYKAFNFTLSRWKL